MNTKALPLLLSLFLWLPLACQKSAAPTATGEDATTLGLRLAAHSATFDRLKIKMESVALDRRQMNRELDSLKEFQAVAQMRLDALRLASAKNRAQAQDDAEGAIFDFSEALKALAASYP